VKEDLSGHEELPSIYSRHRRALARAVLRRNTLKDRFNGWHSVLVARDQAIESPRLGMDIAEDTVDLSTLSGQSRVDQREMAL